MPDDINDIVPEISIDILSKLSDKDREDFLQEWHYLFIKPKKLRLRCKLFGCKPMDGCWMSPYCKRCPGHCSRCFNLVMPEAKIYSK
jgi:hypothetical protein